MLFSSSGSLASSAVEVHPSINPAKVGDNVTLSLSPSVTIESGSWEVGETPILTWQGIYQAVFPSYNGRASVNVLTGALTLSFVTVADSGVYRVQSSEPQLDAITSVTVLGKTKQICDSPLSKYNSVHLAFISVQDHIELDTKKTFRYK